MISARNTLVITAAAAAVVGSQVLPAQAKAEAAYALPTVSKVIPVVHAHADGSATVRATYTCSGGDGGHLYIGVKQGPEINATDHTSSQYAETFYSTNYNSDGPGLTLTCDGKSHTQAFELRADPYFGAGHPDAPALASGQAFVQFCVFDATSDFDEENPTGFAFDYSMKKVVQNG